MVNRLLENLLEAAHRAAGHVHGGPIVYQRGEERVSIDRAAFGSWDFNVQDGDAIRVETSDLDFLFPSRLLILGGRLARPIRGDRIIRVQDDRRDGEIYEVLAPPGEQVYRFCDPRGILMRVHTKQVQ